MDVSPSVLAPVRLAFQAFNNPTPTVVPAASLLKGVAKGAESTSGHVFEPFFESLSSFLQANEVGKPVLLSKIASSSSVQAAWTALQQNSIISKSIKMKDVIMKRPVRFKILPDHCNQPCVQLIGERSSIPNAFLEASAAIQNAVGKKTSNSMHSAIPSSPQVLPQPMLPGAFNAPRQADSASGIVSPLRPGMAMSSAGTQSSGRSTLRPEQISAIEAHLRKNGGKAKLSKIGSLFGIKKLQLASHFTLVPCGIDCLVVLAESPGKASLRGIATDVIETLEKKLSRISVPSRFAIGDIMAFCLDNTKHAAPLSRRLASALGDKGLSTDAALTRLYIISDVISNTACGQPDADRFSACFQDLLPEAFEQLGREWFRRIENHSERSNAEQKIRNVLVVWKQMSIFPQLFTYGLESLLFAPVLEDANMNLSQEPDQTLRQRMARWFSAADQVRLPSACRVRGLAGKALSTAACRSRLCHFERFWHRPGVRDFEDDNLFGDDVPIRPLPQITTLAVAAAMVEHNDSMDSMDIDGEPIDVDGDPVDLDGELLTEEDLVAMELSLDGDNLDT